MEENYKEWESSYSNKETHINKNEYPSNEIVSILMRRYGSLKQRSSVKVLDLGCGWGNNLKFLKDKGFDYTGVDFSNAAVEHCKVEHEKVFCCNLNNLPFESDSFDFAFDRMAIQHNTKEDIQKIFEEVYRVLKPGGVFYSNLVAKAGFDYVTTYLSVEEIKDFAKSFKKLEFDYVEFSLNDGSYISRSNILTAYK